MQRITLNCDKSVPEYQIAAVLTWLAQNNVCVNGAVVELDDDMQVVDSITIANNALWRRHEEERDDSDSG